MSPDCYKKIYLYFITVWAPCLDIVPYDLFYPISSRVFVFRGNQTMSLGVQIHVQSIFTTNWTTSYQSLVGSVVIDAELGREDHSSIPATAIGRGLEPLGAITRGPGSYSRDKASSWEDTIWFCSHDRANEPHGRGKLCSRHSSVLAFGFIIFKGTYVISIL
jgi:hypothetical protein